MLSYTVVSQKFKLKLISAKFLLPMISRNEFSITLSTTLCVYNARGAQGVLPMRVGGATSQLDLTSLTPLSVAVLVDYT